MIVDDDPDFLGELKELLVLSGYEVIAVDSPSAVVKSASASQPEVILLDLKMEDMSGFDVLDGLKACAETSHIPVIVISGILSAERDSSLLKYFKVSDYLQKPFAPFDLIANIETAAARVKERLPAI